MENLKENNVNINSDYSLKYVLASIFEENIPLFYTNNLYFVTFYQEKAISHTSNLSLYKEKRQMKQDFRLFLVNASHALSPTCLIWSVNLDF